MTPQLQDLEPFWKIYTQHNREHIAKHLDRYRIGQLSAADAGAPPLRTSCDEKL